MTVAMNASGQQPPHEASALGDQCVKDFFDTLSPEEKQLFKATTLAKTLLSEVEDADACYKETSTSRKVSAVLVPFIDGIEQYGRALDVFSNSNAFLCPIWGSVRIILHLGREFGEYFDKLAGMLEDIGQILTRLPRYPHLYPDNVRLRESMVEIYQAIFDFCVKAKHVFRVGKSHFCGIKTFKTAVGFTAALRLVWKPFKTQFGAIKDRIAKSVAAVDAEADIAERELANVERKRDDRRWSQAEASQRLLAEYIDGESMTKVNNWLSPVNVAANHKAASSLRHADTGSWFLDGPAFTMWLKMENSFLWLRAIPGAGKTVLASSVINFLREHVQSKETGLAYFYCDYKDAQKQEPSKVLGTILAALAKQNRAVFDEIQSFFLKQYQESSTFTAEFDELLNNFSTFIGSHFRSVIIVIDALDEANPKEWGCLTHALKTLHQRCRRLKILVTSRNELPIARAFDGLPSTSIEQADVASDIQDFIAAELADKIAQRKLKLRDPDLELVIRDTLVEGARGMFQWVRCQIEALCKLRNDKAVRAALSNLPRTLQDTYTRILQRVEDDHPDDVDIVRRILCWLVRGARDMTLEELAEGIAIDPDAEDTSMDFSAVDSDPEDILELLGGLVTVSSDRVISLAHLSVKEFLVSESTQKTKKKFWIDEQSVEAQLASTCLTYLCYDDFREPLMPDAGAFKARLESFKFLQYAAEAWAIHAQRSEIDGHQDNKVVNLTMRLFGLRADGCKNFESWAEVYYHFKKHLGQLTYHRMRPLYCSAFFGLTEATRQLVDEEPGNDATIWRPLKAAVMGGHASVVEIFLQKREAFQADEARRTKDAQEGDGAPEVDGPPKVEESQKAEKQSDTQEKSKRRSISDEFDLGKALYMAAAKGHTEVIGLILDHGADINARGGKDGTALQAASLEGRHEAVQLLLSREASHHIPCKRYGTPLAAAAEKGHQRTVMILLEFGANPNGRGGWYSSPLVSAIVGRNLNIVQCLIKSGADVNSRGGRHGCPLMAAASQGMDDLVQRLVGCGARVNDEDDKSSDALYSASLAGHLSTVNLLLRLGADVNAKGGKHRNALGAASAEGHDHIVKRLLEVGADVSFFDEHYGNALQIAAHRGHDEVVRILAAAGFDPSAEGADKGSALVRAAANGHDSTIQTLHDLGVDMEAGTDRISALVVAASSGYDSTVKLLVDLGADYASLNVQSQTSGYCTAQQAAASKGHLNVVKLLLSLGDNASDSDEGWYGTALIAAIDTDSRSIEIVKLLLAEGGADPNLAAPSESHSYGTPLVHAVRRRDVEVVNLLLDHGADVNLQFETVCTAVQMAATQADDTILNILLEHGGDVNLVTQPEDLSSAIDDGLERGHITALQAAAFNGHDHIVRKLKDLGANLSVEAEDAPFISALQAAAYRGHTLTVKTLLELGSDVNQRGGYFGTALQAAVSKDNLDAVRILIDAGASTNDVDTGHYHSSLMAACHVNYMDNKLEIMNLLLDKGADVNARAKRAPLPFALHVAVAENVRERGVAKLLLDRGADPNACGGKYGTALQVVAKDGDQANTELLLEHGADPNITGGIFNTPLQAAYIHGYFIIIHLLYSHGAVNNLTGGLGGSAMGMGLGLNTKSGDHYGCCGTLIHQLVTGRHFDVNLPYGRWGNALTNCVVSRRCDASFYHIIRAGADLNAVGGRAATALAAAAFIGVESYVDFLLTNGADPNRGHERYPTAAFGAIRGQEPKMLERLLKAGADVIAARGIYGSSLQFAAADAPTHGSGKARQTGLAIARRLLRAGAEPNPPGPPCGHLGTPLQAAAARGNAELVRILLNRGADAAGQGGRFGCVLAAAALHCGADIVELLLKRGARPDGNKSGHVYASPLQGAAARGALDVALVLVRAGADVNARGGRYGSPLQAACAAGHLLVAKLLVEHGANVDTRGGYHGCALQAAAVGGHEEIVRYLLGEAEAKFALVDRSKLAKSIASFDEADELLETIRKELFGGGDTESEGADSGSGEWQDVEEDEEEGEEEPEPFIIPLNVESIPGFQDPWKKYSHWTSVRELTIHSLRQQSLTVEVKELGIAPTRGAAAAMLLALDGANGTRPTRSGSMPSPRPSLANVLDQVEGLTLKHAVMSMPVRKAEEVLKGDGGAGADVGWEALTSLQAGEIAPIHEW